MVEEDIVVSGENDKSYLLANRLNEKMQVQLVSENDISEYQTAIKIYDITTHSHFKGLFQSSTRSLHALAVEKQKSPLPIWEGAELLTRCVIYSSCF